MPKEKKQSVLKRFTPYMGKMKVLLPLSLVLSALAAVLNILPFVLIWFITREILAAPQALDVSNVDFYAWLAFAAALGGIVVYFGKINMPCRKKALRICGAPLSGRSC